MAVPVPDGDRGLYGISVAAELFDKNVQNLRLYEARGLLDPVRTDGGTRRYSLNDLDRLRELRDYPANSVFSRIAGEPGKDVVLN